jgi:hypothetical protein
MLGRGDLDSAGTCRAHRDGTACPWRNVGKKAGNDALHRRKDRGHGPRLGGRSELEPRPRHDRLWRALACTGGSGAVALAGRSTGTGTRPRTVW